MSWCDLPDELVRQGFWQDDIGADPIQCPNQRTMQLIRHIGKGRQIIGLTRMMFGIDFKIIQILLDGGERQ